MAETLGSMIDKLSIKSIREFYINKMIGGDSAFSKKELEGKLRILKRQKKALMAEIEKFVLEAHRRQAPLKDEKLKLYNKRDLMDKVEGVDSLSKGIEALNKKNFELWQLEDEARREDVALSYIGKIKRKIDAANQQRNDLMDRIDKLFETGINKARKAGALLLLYSSELCEFTAVCMNDGMFIRGTL